MCIAGRSGRNAENAFWMPSDTSNCNYLRPISATNSFKTQVYLSTQYLHSLKFEKLMFFCEYVPNLLRADTMNWDWEKETKKIRESMIKKYFFRDGQPTLANSLIAFIDVLGFKDLILNGDSEKNLQKIYDSYLKCFKDVKSTTAIVKTFSDNIILVYPEVEEGNLGSIFITLSQFQNELIKHGLVVRGSIVLGEIHVGEDVIFGKGLVEAYQLESQKAIVPRIILSEKVIKLCNLYRKYYADDSGPYKRVLLKDADGQTFLNYLHNPFVDSRKLLAQYVDEHRKIIEEKLKVYASDIRVFEKYVWLGNYHNGFCGIHKFSSLISADLLARKFEEIK